MTDNTNNTLGVVGGVAAGWASYKYLPIIVKRPYGRWLLTECRDISSSENNKYWSVIQKAVENSSLKERGVEIVDLNRNNLEEVTKDTFDKSDKKLDKLSKDMINKIYEKFKVSKNNIKEFKKKPRAEKPKSNMLYILFGIGDHSKLKRALYEVADGGDSLYHPFTKTICVNRDKMGFSACHEAGHAINANSTKWLKTLSIGRHVTAKLAPILLAIALIKKRKPESPDEPKSEQKKKNFLKDNIGFLTFGCLFPTVAEEGLASINGAKLVKKYLNPQEFKKLNVINAKAWISYLLSAVLVGAFAQFAVKIKDKLVEPKETKC